MTKQQEERITKEMTIASIFSQFPHQSQRLAQAITNAGLHCIGCNAATWETLEGGMLGHGKSTHEIEKLVNHLNGLLNEEVDLSKISLTPRAAKKFLEILEDEGKKGWGMRFGDTAGGCSGFEYVLDYSEKAEEGDDGDETFESHGVQIHIKKKMLKRLMGSMIDYVDGLQGSGFKIINPNVKSSCGCGQSQNY